MQLREQEAGIYIPQITAASARQVEVTVCRGGNGSGPQHATRIERGECASLEFAQLGKGT